MTFNVLDYGAVGGAVVTTANGPAFQAAIDAAYAAGGGIVQVPNDRFYFDPLSTHLEIKPGVCLTGVIPGPFEVYARNPINVLVGPTLLVTANQNKAWDPGGAIPSFLVLDGSCQVANLIIAYPDQHRPVQYAALCPPFVPLVYPFAIAGNPIPAMFPIIPGAFAANSTVWGVTIFNAYDGMLLLAGRQHAHDCRIGGFHIGVQLDYAADRISCERISVAPLWNDPEGFNGGIPLSNADVWCLKNGRSWVIGRADGFSLTDCGSEGSNITFYFYKNGSIGPFGLLTNPFGEASNVGIYVDGATSPNGIIVNGGDFVPNLQEFLWVIGGGHTNGDSVTITLVSPFGLSTGALTHTVGAGETVSTIATAMVALINASNAVVGGAVWMSPFTANTQTPGSILGLPNLAPIFATQLATGTVSASGTSTIVALQGAALNTVGQVTTLQPNTWLYLPTTATGAELMVTGGLTLTGAPSTLQPLVAGAGQFRIQALGYNLGAGPGSGFIQSFLAGASPATLFNTLRYDNIVVTWYGGTNVTVHLGPGTASPVIMVADSGSLVLAPNAALTFAYTASPTIGLYAL